jgi:nitronate monooxygenase
MHSSARSSAGSLHELLRALTFLPRNGIVLAPLAGGPSTPELAAAVSNAGALGFLGAGYLTAEALAAQVRRTRALTGQPIGVNLFRLVPAAVDEAAIARYARELEPEARARGVELGRPHFDDDGYDAKLAVALAAGACAVQVGTSFLLCPEAGTSVAQRAAIAAGGETAMTRAFTGRRARGIVNAFMRAHPDAPSAYPHVHHLTAPLRTAAREAGDADGFNLWAGVSVSRATPLPAAEVVASLLG